MKKIIFIMTFSTQSAEYENQPQPKFSWKTGNGTFIGIWGLEWSDLMLKALVEHYREYDCEVWQPDLRADKVYSAQLQERLVHRKYPAVVIRTFKRCKFVREINFTGIAEIVRQHDSTDTVFMLSAQVSYLWQGKAIAAIREAKVVYYNFLHPSTLIPVPVETHNPFKVLNRIMLNQHREKWLRRINNLYTGYVDPEDLARIRKINPAMQIFRRTFGFELDFWVRNKTKYEARGILRLPQDHFVIVLSQRLVPVYQIDKFIEAISRVKTDRPFSCYITGHGEKEYVNYLSSLVDKYQIQSTVHLVGFVADEELRDYLIAADIFATLPRMSSGSGGALKAMALETPVLHVNKSGTYAFLRDNDAGVFVSPTDYAGWTRMIQDLIHGRPVRIVPRESVVRFFSWGKNAEQTHEAISNLK